MAERRVTIKIDAGPRLCISGRIPCSWHSSGAADGKRWCRLFLAAPKATSKWNSERLFNCLAAERAARQGGGAP